VAPRLVRVDVVPDAPPLSDRTQDLVRAIRALDTPFPVSVTGFTAGFVDDKASLADHLPLAAALVVSTTLVLVFFLTGSVVLPLKTLLMNLLTLSAAFGVLVLVFGSVDATQPILLFALVFGLSTDYGIFLLARIKEGHDAGLVNEEAVARGLEGTGRVVTAAALLFCVAIGAFATSRIVFVRELALGTGFAVAIDATVVRALLVPALMKLLGDWNWWSPAPLRRIHERVEATWRSS
jgi:RND superfamily putative drug exporter